jgi:hypothetical protein
MGTLVDRARHNEASRTRGPDLQVAGLIPLSANRQLTRPINRQELRGGPEPVPLTSDEGAEVVVANDHKEVHVAPVVGFSATEGAGHFLPWRIADWFLPILEDVLKSTTPARVPEAHWRELLISAPPDNEDE